MRSRPEASAVRGGSPGDESMGWSTIPNYLTAVRLVLIVPFLYFLRRQNYAAALAVFLAAGLTDSLDGYLARRFDQSSFVGRIADPVADKLLTGVAFLALAFSHHKPAMPAWISIAAVARDILILAGSVALYIAARNTGFRPTKLGKLNTLVELIVIVTFLLSAIFPDLSIVLPLFYTVLALFLISSLGDYAVQGLTMLRLSRPTRRLRG